MNSAQIGSGARIGLMTGLIAWSCCISAIVLGFLGLGTAAAFFANIQMKYHWWLVGLAFLCMDGAIYYYLKHYHGTCNMKTISTNYAAIAFIVLVSLFTYYLLGAILPPIFELSKA